MITAAGDSSHPNNTSRAGAVVLTGSKVVPRGWARNHHPKGGLEMAQHSFWQQNHEDPQFPVTFPPQWCH